MSDDVPYVSTAHPFLAQLNAMRKAIVPGACPSTARRAFEYRSGRVWGLTPGADRALVRDERFAPGATRNRRVATPRPLRDTFSVARAYRNRQPDLAGARREARDLARLKVGGVLFDRYKLRERFDVPSRSRIDLPDVLREAHVWSDARQVTRADVKGIGAAGGPGAPLD